MATLRNIMLFVVLLMGCNQSTSTIPEKNQPVTAGALLATRFKSLAELKAVVTIEYKTQNTPQVQLTHYSHNKAVISVLKTGISETDFKAARDGSIWNKLWLGIKSPYAVIHREELRKVYILARRNVLEGGDLAFYDIAQHMLYNINDYDFTLMNSEDLSEKGYINTFNHITSQAITTSIFSEKLADFIADTHERAHMPELITGNFTEKQLMDLERGPIDNYVDIVNNEWGQELGKALKQKYGINQQTYWSPELLSNYLNDLQYYYSWVLQVGFKPFRASDELIIKFSKKMNIIRGNVSKLKMYH